MKKLFGLLLALAAMFDLTLAQLQWTVPITVTDGANTKILGAGIHPSGTDGFDLGLDTLAPPAPPPGAFDARLRVVSPANDFFVDIRANTLAQKTYTMIYAPATGFGPIILRWNRTTLASRGAFTIVDNITGTLYTLNMLTADTLNTSSSPFITSSLRILVTPINPLPPSIPTLVSPPDGSTNQPVALTLQWNAATGAATYRLQVATDPSFSTLVVNDSTIVDTSRAVSGLANGTLHYWRVNAKNQFGTSNYSTVRNFTTIVAAPSAPTLVSPANGATNQPTTLAVVWNRPAGATNYRVQVATDLSFTTLVVNDSTLVDTSRVVSGLANGTLHYWRVNARNIGGTSTYSAVRNFTTIVAAPAAPTLVSPANGATNQPTTLTVVWNRSSGATNYRLQAATDLSFTTLVVNDSTLVDTSRVVSGLANGTLHYWRVNARNVGGTSTYSAVRNFTTIVAAPSAPTLVSPANGATNQPTTLTVVWNRSSGATNYRLQAATDLSFTTLVVNDSTLVDTSRVVSGLANGTLHYWRVNARNVGGTSTYSAVRNFTTIVAAPAAPALVSPANGATNQPTTLTVIWNNSAGATNYRLQVATDLSFTTLVVNDSTLVDTSRVVSGLANGTLHYWRVNARNVGGTSTYSAVRNFTTIVAAPSAPTLVSPANGAIGQSTSPTIRWNAAQRATAYRLQLARDSLFTTLVVNDSTLVDTFRAVASLLNNTKYFWRVNARNVGGVSAYSVVWNFTTSLVGVDVPSGLPTEFAIAQNYPNPFNPTTSIRYQIPNMVHVTLTVYDLLGREVTTLVNEEKEAGYYAAQFDASALASGLYFYRLEAGEFTQSRKLILLR